MNSFQPDLKSKPSLETIAENFGMLLLPDMYLYALIHSNIILYMKEFLKSFFNYVSCKI